MKRNIIQLVGIAVTVLLLVSCDKEEGEGGTKAVFSYVADGFIVNFTNFSTSATEYLWDFGDGSGATSTRKSPQHIYTAKGDYLVSLTAKMGEVTSVFIDTVTIIGPNIKIDGDFTDWEYVEYSHVNEDGQGGNLRAVKTFATGTHLHFMLEGTPQMELAIMQIYLDTDRNPETGYKTDWLYPLGSGADYKLEGSITDAWGGVQRHSGNPADGWSGFSGDIASFAEAIVYSEVKTVQDKKVIEFSIDRAYLGAMSNSLNYGILENSSGYVQVGSLPATGYPESKYALYPL